MSLLEALAAWMQAEGLGTRGQDIRVGGAPAGENVPDSLFWLQPSGGTLIKRLPTGQMIHANVILIKYRSPDPKMVYDRINELWDALIAAGCIELSGHKLYGPPDVDTPIIDDDLDAERQKVAMIQVTVRTYKP